MNKHQTGLTRKQKSVLEYIARHVIEHGYQPSYRDMAKHFGFFNPTGCVSHINALVRKGYLVKTPNQGRCLAVNWKRLGLTRQQRMVTYLTRQVSDSVRWLPEAPEVRRSCKLS